MKVKAISTVGFKETDGGVFLGQMNLLRGPVGSGKTQVMDAIQMAVLGCVPRVGKNSASTLKLVRESKAEVSIAFDDDSLGTQSIERQKSGSKSDARASWLPSGATKTEHAKAIMGRFGASDEEAAENLDIMRLLGRNNSELARVIEELLGKGGIDVETRVEMAIQKCGAYIDSNRKKVEGLLQPVDPAVLAALDLHGATLRKMVAEGLVKALDWAGEQKRASRRALDGKIKARGELEDRIALIAAPASDEEDLSSRDQALRDEQSSIRERISLARKARAEKELAGQAVVKWTLERDRALEALEAVKARDVNVDALNEAAAAIVDPPEVETFHPKNSSENEDWQRLKAEIESIEDLDRPEKDALVEVPEPIDTRLAWFETTKADRAMSEANASPWVEVAQIAECLFSESGELDNEIERLKQIAAENAPDIDALLAAANKAAEDYQEAKKAADIRAHEIAEAKEWNDRAESEYSEALDTWKTAQAEKAARRKALSDEMRAIESGTAQGNRQGSKEWEERRDARKLKLIENDDERNALLQKANSYMKDLAKAEEDLAGARGALAESQARVDGVAAAIAVDIEGDEARVPVITAEIETIQNQLALVRRARAARDEMRAMVREINKLTADQEVFAAAEWALKRVRDEDMQNRSAGLEARMTTFLRAAGREETPYLRCAKGAAEFGWTTPAGRDVAVEVLSGGQSVVYRAALAYAILMSRDPAVKILNIELAEAADGSVADALLKGCGAICDDVQVVVSSCVPVDVPSESWTVIEFAR